jgi:Kef-type K+ transport system membrane component KefB
MGSLSASQVVGFVLLDIALILVVARIVGWLFTRIGQPRVVGEIVAGILLGPTLLGATLWPEFVAPLWMHCVDSLSGVAPGTPPTPTACLFPAQSRSVLGNVGQLALLLFMLLTGLEIDFARLKGRLSSIALVGIGSVIVPVALGFALKPVLSTELFRSSEASDLGFVLFVGAILAVTAFPVMVRILQEKNLTTSPIGAIGIAAAAITTIGMFITASLASGIAANTSGTSLAAKIFFTVTYLVVMVALVKPLLARVGRRYSKTRNLDSGFSAAIVIVTIASGYVAHQLGLTVIIGGFMAGIVLPERASLYDDMSERLAEITGTILLPIFLAFSGLATDFTLLTSDALLGIGLLLLAGIVGKWAGGAVLARLGGSTWAEGNVLGVLMNCRGLLVLVVALIGVQQGVITPVLQLGAVLMALITTAMTGPLFDRFVKRVPGSASLVLPADG